LLKILYLFSLSLGKNKPNNLLKCLKVI